MIGILVLAGLTSRTPVLTYHDIVLNRTKSSVWFDCTVQEFRDQIRWLRKSGAVFVSTSDLCEAMIKKKPLPKGATCITFADNYEGFYRYAWPILKRERIPVTQFVHTGFVGSKVGRPKMTREQLKELDSSGLVTIASQTTTHPEDLTTMSDSEVAKEFSDSKRYLEVLLGHPISQLAYPNGKYDLRVAGLAKKAGYKIAFTEDCHPAELAKSMWTVPRYVHTKYRQAWLDRGKRGQP